MTKLKHDFSKMARILGKRGGLERARNMTAKEKTESARNAVRIRWMIERKRNGLRHRDRRELILTAKGKTMEDRLTAFFVLSRSIALLSSVGKSPLEIKNAAR